MRTLSFAAAFVAACFADSVSSAQEGVDLRVDKPVVAAGSTDPVRFTLLNTQPDRAHLSLPALWRIVRGDGQVVFDFASLPIPASLGTGESKTWEWNKRDKAGNPLPAGNYSILVGKILQGNSKFDVQRTFAFTSAGPLATQATPFPLAVGNEWHYSKKQPCTKARVMKISASQPGSGWFRLEKAPLPSCHDDVDVKITQMTSPKLLARGHSSGEIHTLFEFNRPEGYSWNTKFIGTQKVISADQTIATPAGVFHHCTRIKVVAPHKTGGFKYEYWIAPGIGIVQYMDEGGIFHLTFAKLVRTSGGSDLIGNQ